MSAVQRFAGWFNEWTGLGTSRDKATLSQIGQVIRLTDEEVSALYHGSWLAHRVCTLRAEEAFAAGWSVQVDGESESEEAKALTDAWKALRVREKSPEAIFTDAAAWGLAWGGAALLLGADDGQALDMPLTEPRALRFVKAYDKRDLARDIMSVESFDASPEYGMATRYYVQPATSGRASQRRAVHVSRLIFFPGADTADRERERLDGWDYSALQRVHDDLRAWGVSWQAVENLIQDASQGVWRIKGLLGMIGRNARELQERMTLVEMGRSVARAIMLDTEDESFERKDTSFSGVPDIIDKLAARISGATGFPVTKLFGVSPGGLNATGESDAENWNKSVDAYRTGSLEPRMLRVLRIQAQILGIEPQRVAIEWHPLAVEKPMDEATRRKTIIDGDAVLISSGQVTEDEIALHRFKVGGWDDSPAIEIDRDARAPQPTTVDVPPIALAPTDVVKLVTMNEARASQGLGPMLLPNGTPDPDGGMSVASYSAKQEAKQAAAAAVSTTDSARYAAMMDRSRPVT